MTAATLTAASSHPTTTSRNARSTGRWTQAHAAIRRWFAAGQLGPVDNYVTR